jgi:hypothetical protein
VQVQSGGNITLDTGTGTGTVTITGNLDVKGTTTTVESNNTTVQDNILQLNVRTNSDPEYSSSGISSVLGYQAGIEIERGNAAAAQLLFSEQYHHYDSLTDTDVQGTFVLQTRNISNNSASLTGLALRTLTTDGVSDLTFDLRSSSSSVLRIANATNYAARLSDPDDIPNLDYVSNFVATSLATVGVDQIRFPNYGPAATQIKANSTTIDFKVLGTLEAQITSAGFIAGNIVISGDTIQDTNVSNIMVIQAGSNNVKINSILGLANQTSATPTAGSTKIYSSATTGPGGSGIYFTNNNAAPVADELISRRRAVLLSILL